LGENLRSIATALEFAGVPFEVEDVFQSDAHEQVLLEDFHPQSSAAGARPSYRANLYCLNANEMDVALTYLGPEAFHNTYGIGLWMWELSEFPDKWCSSFRYVEEIWAQSRFVQEAIARKSNIPVIWMPQVVEPGPADPTIAKKLGVPVDAFSFLFLFDFTSYVTRKNPQGVIDAFHRAFFASADERVCLVLKVNGGDKRPADYRAFVKRMHDLDERIVLIDRVLSDKEIKGLIAGCDVFVSLHRSEGFGRGIAESMYYGKPTIVTAYSGNMDFNNHLNSCLVEYDLVRVKQGEYPFGKGQFWASPDVQQAADWMVRLYADRDFCKEIGTRAAQSIRETHGAAVVGQRMQKRLTGLGLL
jgi:glycosyltransferase involved in cell wall biosynthesis